MDYLQNKPQATIDDTCWLSNSANKPFNSSLNNPNQPQVFFVRKGSQQKKNCWTVEKTQITQFFESSSRVWYRTWTEVFSGVW